MKNFQKAVSALLIGASVASSTALLSSCSSDNNDEPTTTTEPTVIYKGNVAYSDGILFKGGTELGNGTQNFHFTGDVTLPKGTYLLKDGCMWMPGQSSASLPGQSSRATSRLWPRSSSNPADTAKWPVHSRSRL